LPKLITFSSGNTIEIVYDASGNKLRKIVKQGATVQYEQDYSGGIEYRKTPAAGAFRIEAIYHEEGRYFNLNVDASNTPSWRKEYALRDCTLPPRRNHEEVEKRVFFHFQIVKHAQEYHQ